MKILIFDTETTGKCNFNLPADHDCQPRLVQLGLLIIGINSPSGELPLASKRCDLWSTSIIVRPEGFQIPYSAANIHGISTEKASECGVSLSFALNIFNSAAKEADLLVAFNNDYDKLVVDGEYLRRGKPTPFTKPELCVMKAMTPICNLPAPAWKPEEPKWPSLEEAVIHCFLREPENAHDALGDVMETRNILYWMIDNGHYTPKIPLDAPRASA